MRCVDRLNVGVLAFGFCVMLICCGVHIRQPTPSHVLDALRCVLVSENRPLPPGKCSYCCAGHAIVTSSIRLIFLARDLDSGGGGGH